MSIKQPVPPMRELHENVADDPTPYVLSLGYDVASWSPGKAGEGVPCTQVHLILTVPGKVRLALRLKSARALDELVAVLLQHRKDVWGPKEGSDGPAQERA